MHLTMRAMAASSRKRSTSANYRTLPQASRAHAASGSMCPGSRLERAFLVDQRATLPVVEVALLLRQPRRVAFHEAALDEPAGRARGQDEQARQAQLAR